MLQLDCFFLYYFESLKKDSSCTYLQRGETSKFNVMELKLRSNLVALTAKLEKLEKKYNSVLVTPFISTTEERVRLILKYLKATMFLKDRKTLLKISEVFMLHVQHLLNYYINYSSKTTPTEVLHFLLNLFTLLLIISKLSFHLFLQQLDSHFLYDIIYMIKTIVLDHIDWILFFIGESFSQKENFSRTTLILSHLLHKYSIALYLFSFPSLTPEYSLDEVLNKIPTLLDALPFWQYLRFTCLNRDDLLEKDKLLEFSRHIPKMCYLDSLMKADLAKLDKNKNTKKLYFEMNQVVQQKLKSQFFGRLMQTLTFGMEDTLHQESSRSFKTEKAKVTNEYLFHFGSIERNYTPSPAIVTLCDAFCSKYVPILKKQFSFSLRSYYHFIKTQQMGSMPWMNLEEEEQQFCGNSKNSQECDSQQTEEDAPKTVDLCSSQDEEEDDEPIIKRQRRL